MVLKDERTLMIAFTTVTMAFTTAMKQLVMAETRVLNCDIVRPVLLCLARGWYIRKMRRRPWLQYWYVKIGLVSRYASRDMIRG